MIMASGCFYKLGSLLLVPMDYIIGPTRLLTKDPVKWPLARLEFPKIRGPSN